MIITAIVVLAAIGFFISAHIYYEKHIKHEDLTCNITSGCNDVVNSEYGNIGPIPLEVVGMLYYGTVIAVGLFYTFIATSLTGVPVIGELSLFYFLLVIGGIAAFVSVILTYIQFAILEIWCEYCLTSAFVSFAIFALEVIPEFTNIRFADASVRGGVLSGVGAVIVFLVVYLIIEELDDRKQDTADVSEEELDRLMDEADTDNVVDVSGED